MKWDYRVEKWSCEESAENLSKLGVDGWELTSVVQLISSHDGTGRTRLVFYFKKPIKEALLDE